MPLKRFVRQFDDEAEVVAEMDLGTMWDRLLAEFLDEWVRLDRQGLPDEEVEAQVLAHMEGLSEKPLEDLARKTSDVSYNQGRNMEILTAGAQGKAEFVVRSEILDNATCDVCQELDGSVFRIGSPEYHQYMPPALCLGRDRCRGFYIAIGG